MFTIEQIRTVHAKVKSGADFPQYVQDIRMLGVHAYDAYVTDGHSDFYGADNYKISSPSKYPVKEIAPSGNAAQLKQALVIHQQGQTDYLAFCDQAAAAGVEKWTTYVTSMEVVYYDKAGNALLTEVIPR